MYSQRLRWNLPANRLAQIWAEKKSHGLSILDLTASNPTAADLLYDERELLLPLADPASALYEPNPRGLRRAREAVAGYYADRGELIDPRNLFLTTSTSEAYAYLFKLLADPGDEILAPLPCYPLLDYLTALESVHLRHYPLRYTEAQGWRIDGAALENLVTTKTVAFVLVHPNNPAGSFVKAPELARVNALCAEHHLALICDEVFLDYAVSHETAPPASLVMNDQSLTFVLSGLSKVCALPQMKLGWIHVNGAEALRAEAMARLEFISDTYLSVGTPVQHAAEKMLALRHGRQQQIRLRIATNEACLRANCRDRQSCQVLLREGGWYAVLAIPAEISEEDLAVDLLQQENVFVHPGYFFDFPTSGFLVLSLLTPPEIFSEGVGRVMKMIVDGG